MNITEEVIRMIDEMRARTGNAPARVVCNRETLNWLWNEGRGIYSNAEDVENGTGYIARFMGTPIIVSEDVETGKFLMIPELSMSEDSTFRTEYLGRPYYIGQSSSGEDWWVGGRGSFRTSSDWFNAEYYPRQQQAPVADDAEVEISEDSFMSILDGRSD